MGGHTLHFFIFSFGNFGPPPAFSILTPTSSPSSSPYILHLFLSNFCHWRRSKLGQSSSKVSILYYIDFKPNFSLISHLYQVFMDYVSDLENPSLVLGVVQVTLKLDKLFLYQSCYRYVVFPCLCIAYGYVYVIACVLCLV